MSYNRIVLWKSYVQPNMFFFFYQQYGFDQWLCSANSPMTNWEVEYQGKTMGIF